MFIERSTAHVQQERTARTFNGSRTTRTARASIYKLGGKYLKAGHFSQKAGKQVEKALILTTMLFINITRRCEFQENC